MYATSFTSDVGYDNLNIDYALDYSGVNKIAVSSV